MSLQSAFKNIKKKLPTTYFKNIGVLLSGNTISRIVPFFLMPVLLVFYTPASFALFGIFTAITNILNSVSSGNYEFAIILPDSKEEARRLKRVSLLLCTGFSLLVVVVFFLGRDVLIRYADTEAAVYLIAFIPLALIINTSIQINRQWAIRERYFGIISVNYVINSTAVILLQLFFGAIHLIQLGLIMGFVVGKGGSLLFLVIGIRRKEKQERTPPESTDNSVNTPEGVRAFFHEARKLLSLYRDFPLYRMPSILVNRLTNDLPFLIFQAFFNVSFVGNYNFIKQLLNAPISVVSRSLGEAFQSRLKRDLYKKTERQHIFTVTVVFLSVAAVIGFGIMFFFGDDLIKRFLSNEWVLSGLILQLLIPKFVLTFISSPITHVFPLMRKLNVFFILELILFGVSVAGTFVIATATGNPNSTLLYFSLTYALISCGIILIAGRVLKAGPVQQSV